MAQAKTLTETELRRVLDHVATRKHAQRNRALVLVTHLAGMRVGEVASLRYEDVVDCDKKIRNEIRLDAEQTKGRHSRIVFVSERLRKELTSYVKRRREGFTANTLTQHFLALYKNVGIEGASSHSGRRTYATTMASKGVGVRVLMRALGHRNISTTMQYVDASDDMIRRAVDLI